MNNPILTIKSILSENNEKSQEDFERAYDEMAKNHIYDSTTYMKEILKFDDTLVNDIYNYYKESAVMLILKSSNISEYRKKLIAYLNDNIIIDKTGKFLYKEKNHEHNKRVVKNPNQLSFFSNEKNDNINNFFSFLALQYEEDVVIDNIYDSIEKDIINFSDLNYHKFSFNVPEYSKSYFYDKFNHHYDKTSDKPSLVFKVEKIYSRYVHRGTCNFIVLASYRNKYFPAKLRYITNSPAIYVIGKMLENSNIRVINNQYKIFETVNSKTLLYIPHHSWILEDD